MALNSWARRVWEQPTPLEREPRLSLICCPSLLITSSVEIVFSTRICPASWLLGCLVEIYWCAHLASRSLHGRVVWKKSQLLIMC